MTIEIKVENCCAKVIGSPMIVADNSEYEVHFIFDEPWDEYPVKTVRFRNSVNGSYTDILTESNWAQVPRAYYPGLLEVGVYAGNQLTTSCAELMIVKSILSDGGTLTEEESDLYGDLMKLINAGIYKSMKINDAGHLIATLANGKSVDYGMVRGEKGEKGDKGEKGEPGLAPFTVRVNGIKEGSNTVTFTGEQIQSNAEYIVIPVLVDAAKLGTLNGIGSIPRIAIGEKEMTGFTFISDVSNAIVSSDFVVVSK